MQSPLRRLRDLVNSSPAVVSISEILPRRRAPATKCPSDEMAGDEVSGDEMAGDHIQIQVHKVHKYKSKINTHTCTMLCIYKA